MILIKNCNLWTMKDINGENLDVLIEGRKIKEIGKIEASNLKDVEVIDAMGQFVMPGIVDPHCHIGLFQQFIGWAGSDGNECTNPVTPELRGIDAVKCADEYFDKALKAGVTTVCTGPGSANVIGGTFCLLKTYGKTIDEKVIVEEVAMKMALGENPKRVYQNNGNQTRMATASVLRESLIQAKFYKEKWDKYQAKIEKNEECEAPQYNGKWHSLKRVLEGFPVKIHAHLEDDILTALKIIKEFNLNATIDHCTSGWRIPEKLKEYGASVILGPTLGDKTKYELKDKSFDAAKVMYDNNIPFSIMTDHPVVCLSNTKTQLALFAHHGLPYLECLRAVTIYAAKSCHVEHLVGSIEVGKDADIVVYDNDPLHYMTNTKLVMINGKVVYRN